MSDYIIWVDRAKDNTEKWGEQDIPTLLLAMQEELGELTRAYLQYMQEDADYEHIREELNDLAPLMFQLEQIL